MRSSFISKGCGSKVNPFPFHGRKRPVAKSRRLRVGCGYAAVCTFALLFAKFVDFREDSAGKLGCYFGECIDVGVAGGQQSSDDSLTSLGEVIAMCGAYFA